MRIINKRPDNFDDAFTTLMDGVQKDVGSPILRTEYLKQEGNTLHYHVTFVSGKKMLAMIQVLDLKGEYALRFRGNYIK